MKGTGMSRKTIQVLLGASISALLAAAVRAADPEYFAIEVVDGQTGRGVPMVELETTSRARWYTDSSGLVAFSEPGLMGRKVWFSVSSHGYEFPADGFGMCGVAIDVKPGGTARATRRRSSIRRGAST
jgi:hypothetical protein